MRAPPVAVAIGIAIPAFAADAAVGSTVRGTQADETGTILGNCPNAPVNILEIDGWPQDARYDDRLDAMQALLTCQATQIDYTVHLGIVDAQHGTIPDAHYTVKAAQLDAILAAIGATGSCDTDSEIGMKVDDWCRQRDSNRNGTHGTEFTARVTVTGKECTGTCTDGTAIKVTCRRVCGDPCV